MTPGELLDRAAAAPALLLATDFDGTLAEIVPSPEAARAAPGALEALGRLSGAPGVHVAIVSGRSIADLSPRTAGLDGVWRVGEHGAQIAEPGGARIQEAAVPADALDELERVASSIAAYIPGVRVERKRSALAVHWRGVAEQDRGAALAALGSWAEDARRAGLAVLEGRSVHEARGADQDKARALARVLTALPAGTTLIYAGDDTTDEPAIALARERGGVGVYVASAERPSSGVTADLVLEGPGAWVALLAELAERRHG